MNGDVPWRGPREKGREFMQMLVEASFAVGDVVFDCTAGTSLLLTANLDFISAIHQAQLNINILVNVLLTGSCIQACRATCRHILAFEEDKAIFDALIAPILRPAAVNHPQPDTSVEALGGEEEEDIVIQKVQKTNRFSK